MSGWQWPPFLEMLGRVLLKRVCDNVVTEKMEKKKNRIRPCPRDTTAFDKNLKHYRTSQRLESLLRGLKTPG